MTTGEVPESTDDPRIAARYQHMRRVTGLPGINLFYRRIAARGADVLDTFWAAVEPLYVSGALPAAGEALQRQLAPPRLEITRELLVAAELAGANEQRLEATLRYFNRANAMHLVLFTAATHQGTADATLTNDAPGTALPSTAGVAPEDLLPLQHSDALPPASRQLIDDLRDTLVPRRSPLEPTLLRHLAGHPRFLAEILEQVRAEGETFRDAVAVTRAQASTHAGGLPRVREGWDADLRTLVDETAEDFLPLIPAMLVLGTAILEGLPTPRTQT